MRTNIFRDRLFAAVEVLAALYMERAVIINQLHAVEAAMEKRRVEMLSSIDIKALGSNEDIRKLAIAKLLMEDPAHNELATGKAKLQADQSIVEAQISGYEALRGRLEQRYQRVQA